MRKALLRLVIALGRTPVETAALRELRPRWRKALLFFAIAAALAVFHGVPLVSKIRAWHRFAPDVALRGDVWHLLPVKAGEGFCTNRSGELPTCLANEETSPLWSAPRLREHIASRESRAARARRPSEFWLGASIPLEVRSRAFEKGAHRLLLGWITAPYRIWINGTYVGGGGGWGDIEPIFLNLSATKLFKARPLKIAIHFYGSGQPGYAPDEFNTRSGGEGFVTTASENLFRAYSSFATRVRPFSLTVAYAVAAILFFFLWFPSPVRQEYLFMALFSLAGAGYQAQDIDLWTYERPPELMYLLWSSFLFYQAAFALFLGLSFARAKAAVFRWGVPLCIAAPILGHLASWSPESPRAVLDFTQRFFVPLAYLLSAAACWLEADHLRQLRGDGASLRLRGWRLRLFGTGLAALGVYYGVEFNGRFPSLNRLYWLTSGTGEFFLVLYLAGIALREFGEQEQLIARTPVSRYHKLPVLPERVNGALLVVDLKNSEALFRLGAREGDAGKIVDTCISHLWTAVAENGGIVLQTEGDAIRALFDADFCEDPAASALRATDRMVRELETLDGRIRSQHALAVDFPKLSFRGGIAVGAVRPIWHDFAGTHHASWIEAGSSNAFVESTRLMDLEREVAGPPTGIRVILAEEIATARLQAGTQGRWQEQGLELAGKHGLVYRVCVYVPGDIGAARGPVSAPRSVAA